MERSPRSSPLVKGTTSSGCSRENAEPVVTNRVLASSPRNEVERLYPALSRTTLSRGHVLQTLANSMGSLYFPLGGMIGLFTIMADGRTVVRAATGREGFIGISAFLGADMPPSRVVVLVAGYALVLPTAKLQKCLSDSPQFGVSLRRYCSDYVAQVAQIGACHALHSVQQRVALWLLLTRDYSDSASALVTHELLSELLGCRRSSVSETLSLLEESGVIRGGRGEIEISDPSRLAEMACECYGVLSARQTTG
jgi:CRP-like cAMP-binding protein